MQTFIRQSASSSAPRLKGLSTLLSRQGLLPRCLKAFALGACLWGGSLAQAQPPAAAAPTPEEVRAGEQIFQVVAPSSKISMIALETRIIDFANRIKVVEGFDPTKITVTPLSPMRLRIKGETPGVTSVQCVDEFDSVFKIEVFVEPDTRELEAYLEKLFPGSAIEVVGIRDAVVLRGWVTDPTHIPQIMAVAEQMYTTVHNQLSVANVSQVQLHVKVLEIQRTKLRELGFNFLLNGGDYMFSNAIGALAPLSAATVPFGGPITATVGSGAFSNSEMQFAIAGNSDIFQGFIKALQSEALAKILAEPVLVTTSGRPATMLSGGEFPVLVPQSLGTVSIEWREFGVRLEAVPIVLGDGRLRLDIAPEVSERDFSNAVSINGFVVPGITVRRVNTQVEMRFGQTLMVGGLISNRRTGTARRIPFLGELPWVGAAFSRKDYNYGETELVILVTPQMAAAMDACEVPPGGPGLGTDIPTDKELYLDGMLEVPFFGSDCPDCEPGYGQPSGGMMQQYQGAPSAPPVDGGAIQTTAGEETDKRVVPAGGANPFRVNVQRDRKSGSTEQGSSGSARPSGSNASSASSSRANLPGLIQPDSEGGESR